MIDKLEDAIYANKNTFKYLERAESLLHYENIYNLPEIRTIDVDMEIFNSSRIRNLICRDSKLNIQRSGDESIIIPHAITLYIIFDAKLQNLISFKYYLYSIMILSEYFIGNYYEDLTQIQSCLESYFFYESRKILNILKEKVLLCPEVVSKEKKNIIKIFENWLDLNIKFIGNVNGMLVDTVLQTLKSILGSFDKYKNLIFEQVHLNIDHLSDSIKKHIHNIMLNNLIDPKRGYQVLKTLIDESPLEITKKVILTNILKDYSFEFLFPLSYPMIEHIDNLMPNFFSLKLMDLSKITHLITEFFNKNQTIIDQLYKIYLETKSTEEVTLDIILIRFISNFMFFFDKIYRKFEEFNEKVEFKNVFNIKSFLISLLKLSKTQQRIALDAINRQIVSNIEETYAVVLKKFINQEPDLRELRQDIKEEFRRRLMCHPFRTVLIEFLPDENLIFEDCIEEILSKTFTMTFPHNILGITLYSRAVVLRQCTNSEFENAATFYIFLHEAAQYLQRVQVKNLGEADRPFSADCNIRLNLDEDLPENFEEWSNKEALKKINYFKFYTYLSSNVESEKQSDDFQKEMLGEILSDEDRKSVEESENKEGEEKQTDELPREEKNNMKQEKTQIEIISKNKPGIEGGKFLEIALFGKQYEILYLRGAQFLLSDLKHLSLPQFRKQFSQENVALNSDEFGYPVKGGNYYHLGKCPGYLGNYRIVFKGFN